MVPFSREYRGLLWLLWRLRLLCLLPTGFSDLGAGDSIGFGWKSSITIWADFAAGFTSNKEAVYLHGFATFKNSGKMNPDLFCGPILVTWPNPGNTDSVRVGKLGKSRRRKRSIHPLILLDREAQCAQENQRRIAHPLLRRQMAVQQRSGR